MIKKRISAVFRVTDAVTGKAVGKSLITLYINGSRSEAIYKDGGFLLAMNLPDGTACFEFRSPYYQVDRVERNINGAALPEEVIPVMLQPDASYPRMAELTRVSGRLNLKKASQGITEVILAYSSEDKFKLAQETVKKNSSTAMLYSAGNGDNAGKAFVIQDKDGNGSEFCRIIKGPAEDGSYTFEKAFEYNHKRGDVMKKAVRVFPDENGSFLFAVNDFSADDAEAEIIVLSSAGKYSKKMNIAGGTLNDAGVIGSSGKKSGG